MSTMHLENYGIYSELVNTGYITIQTASLNDDNIDQHFQWIINILNDGIERYEIQHLKIHVVFVDNKEINLFIIDYMFNLMFWSTIVSCGQQITSFYFFDSVTQPITKKNIKKYIDTKFIKFNLKTMDFIKLNQSIDRSIGKFRALENYQMYLANTINLEDTIKLMQEYPEFNESVHFDPTGIPLEDVKDVGMKAANLQIDIIKKTDHCLKDAFIAGEGISPKQFKEVNVNIGTKPNGQGGVYPHPIKGSFINGGLSNVEELVIESSIGRIAQILQKQNVGQSGSFARNLGLNNQDSKLHQDPNYSCNTKNFEIITIENSDMLDEFNMRYYRLHPNGLEYLLDAERDKHLVGQTIYLRSPMTCASAAKGQGICYKCYGDLAYINRDINIGQIASELLSSIYTQILLSAKHLLESAIVKMHWTEGFFDLFAIDYNHILLKEDMNWKGFKLIIDEPNDAENDSDEDDILYDDYMNDYINNFKIVFPDGRELEISTYSSTEMDTDNIYIHQDLLSYMDKVGTTDFGYYEFDMQKLAQNVNVLFIVDVKNNELSKTMKTIKNIIDNKKITKSYNIHTILTDFIKTNLAGNIKMNAVHFEVLLMNQIRAADDLLELPDWSNENESYQLLTLSESLNNNRSISVRLQASKIARALTHPHNSKLKQPSNMDLFYMEQPQTFMTNEYIKSTYQPKAEYDKKVIKPMYFIKNKANEEASEESFDE